MSGTLGLARKLEEWLKSSESPFPLGASYFQCLPAPEAGLIVCGSMKLIWAGDWDGHSSNP